MYSLLMNSNYVEEHILSRCKNHQKYNSKILFFKYFHHFFKFQAVAVK
jgi:hypothetical protein